MNISSKVQQLSHEVRNFEADDRIPSTYSEKKRSTYLKHRSTGMKQFKIEAIRKLALDKVVKHDVQIIKLQDFLKVAAIIVDDAGNVIAVEKPTGVLSEKSNIRVFRIIPESSTTKSENSYWSFLDHIGDRIYVLNCSHNQKINFDVFHDKKEQERFYDMIATGFVNYSSKRRSNEQLLGQE